MIDADSSLAEVGGGRKAKTFWEWFQYWYVLDKICSRQDAEKRMELAQSADPNGALAEERRAARERVAAYEAKAALGV